MSSYFHGLKDLFLGVGILMEDVFERYKMDEKDRAVVMNGYRDVCYQFASGNASACTVEKMLRERGVDTNVVTTDFQKYARLCDKKMRETYPEDWDRDSEALRRDLDLEELRDWYGQDMDAEDETSL